MERLVIVSVNVLHQKYYDKYTKLEVQPIMPLGERLVLLANFVQDVMRDHRGAVDAFLFQEFEPDSFLPTLEKALPSYTVLLSGPRTEEGCAIVYHPKRLSVEHFPLRISHFPGEKKKAILQQQFLHIPTNRRICVSTTHVPMPFSEAQLHDTLAFIEGHVPNGEAKISQIFAGDFNMEVAGHAEAFDRVFPASLWSNATRTAACTNRSPDETAKTIDQFWYTNDLRVRSCKIVPPRMEQLLPHAAPLPSPGTEERSSMFFSDHTASIVTFSIAPRCSLPEGTPLLLFVAVVAAGIALPTLWRQLARGH